MGRKPGAPRARSDIRTLAPGEQVPTGPPRRYRTDDGYIRLRWLIGREQYVECLEHRVVDGRIVEAGYEIHHINRVRDDNRPENLMKVTRTEHLELHGRDHAEEIVRLYRAGRNSTEIAAGIGVHPSTVCNQLRLAGVTVRSRADYRPALDLDLIRQWHAAGVRVHEMSRRTGRGRPYINGVLDSIGLPRFPTGRPPVQKEK